MSPAAAGGSGAHAMRLSRRARSRCGLGSIIATVVALGGVAFGGIACAPAGMRPAGIHVVASTSLFAEMAQNVAGARVTVDSLAPAGVSVADCSASPAGARRAADADVPFGNGLPRDLLCEPRP